MFRPLLLAALLVSGPAWQAPERVVLHIRVTLATETGEVAPLARHRLLISDNPSTTSPRSVVTAADGTATVALPPGNYTVESDQPIIRNGRSYHWTETLDVEAGREARLELTPANVIVESPKAEVSAATDAPPDPGAGLLERWAASTAELWTPTTRGTGFVVDSRGLVATNQRIVGEATAIEVQLSPTFKVPGVVLVAQPGRDVAMVRVDAAAVATLAPVPLECDARNEAPPEKGQPVHAIDTPLLQPRAISSGLIGHVGPHMLETDLDLDSATAGGPAFLADGRFVGLTSIVDGSDPRHPYYRIVRPGDICAVLRLAREAMATATAMASGSPLPVEPVRSYSRAELESAAERHAGRRTPYVASSSDFDVAFITPPLAYAARHRTRPTSLPVRGSRPRMPDPEQELRAQGLVEFAGWSDYLESDPPVLVVRVTPRLVEGFWRMIARGAVMSQGGWMPAMKHFKAGFSRLQAFCGANEVTPIHPLRVDRPLPDGASIAEGLYVFDPDALGPRCGTVRLVLYSEKSPTAGKALVVERELLEEVAADFAALRTEP